MKHVIRIGIKFLSCLVVLGIILGMFYNFSFGDVLLITTVLGVISYLLGDLFILRATNNFIASAADFALTFLLVWFMGQALTFENNLFSAALFSAIAVGLFEFIFHRSLTNDKNQQTTKQQTNTHNRPQYQTEAADELTPVRPDVRTPEKDNK